MSAAYIQVFFRLDFIIGAYNMNPDPFWLHIVCNIGLEQKQMTEPTVKVMMNGERKIQMIHL